MGLRVTDLDVERFRNPYYSTIRFNSEFVLRRIKFNRGWELMNPLDINNTNYFYTNKTHAHFAIDFNFTNEFTNVILGFESKFENSSGLHVWFDDDSDTLCDICKSWSKFFGFGMILLIFYVEIVIVKNSPTFSELHQTIGVASEKVFYCVIFGNLQNATRNLTRK